MWKLEIALLMPAPPAGCHNIQQQRGLQRPHHTRRVQLLSHSTIIQLPLGAFSHPAVEHHSQLEVPMILSILGNPPLGPQAWKGA